MTASIVIYKLHHWVQEVTHIAISEEAPVACTDEAWCCCARCEEAKMDELLKVDPPKNMIPRCDEADGPLHGPMLPSVVWKYEYWRVKLPRAIWLNVKPFSKLTETEVDEWMCNHSDIVTQANVCDYWEYKFLPF